MGKPWAWFEQQPFQGNIFVIGRYFVFKVKFIFFTFINHVFVHFFQRFQCHPKKMAETKYFQCNLNYWDLVPILQKTIFFSFYKYLLFSVRRHLTSNWWHLSSYFSNFPFQPCTIKNVTKSKYIRLYILQFKKVHK